MSDSYDFKAIEKKWQKKWEEDRRYEVAEQAGKPAYYVLEMLPYPSGALHMGHVRNYSLGDSLARYRKMQGYNVLHPIGWDAFGLPAENAAIENNVPPEEWTLRNISRMKEQCQRMGWAYDWTREFATCTPEYYQWNQWFFIQMFKKGLAYKKKALVNWCERCQTVLANEQVEAGMCWRHKDVVVEEMELEQWFLRTTAYTEELLQALDDLPGFPEKVLRMQRNWIGKSVGAQVHFQIADSEDSVEVFTTRVDTIFGATFVVLAPDHDLARTWDDASENGQRISQFAEEIRSQSREERVAEEGEKRGVFTGRYAVNPFSGEKVPVYVANFVLKEYGTGAIMAVPAHDQRDYEFAKKYDLPIRLVVQSGDLVANTELTEAVAAYGVLVNSGEYNDLPSEVAQDRMAEDAEKNGFGHKSTTYSLRDWGVSRQRYWGTPIPMINCDRCGIVPVPEEDLPVILPKVEGIQLGGSPLTQIDSFVQTPCPSCGEPARRETDTMDTFVDSSWYFFRYVDAHNEDSPYSSEAARYWLPVDFYIGGVEHAVLHIFYMRFFCKMMRDLGLISFDEPVKTLFTQGMVIKDGAKMSKSLGNTVSPDEVVQEYGADSVRLFIQFCAPPDGELDWNDQGLEGCSRFLRRVWRTLRRFEEEVGTRDLGESPSLEDLSSASRQLVRKTHQTVRKVTDDLERFHQNTAVSAIMELLNSTTTWLGQQEVEPVLFKGSLEKMTLLLAPFTPHLAEEIWSRLGHGTTVTEAPWPEFDPELAKEEEIQIVVQINGKVRSRFSTAPDVSRETMQELALKDEKIRELIEGKSVVKVIAVPGKLVNIVVRG
jgi:leucyl-tRNA synthetase